MYLVLPINLDYFLFCLKEEDFLWKVLFWHLVGSLPQSRNGSWAVGGHSHLTFALERHNLRSKPGSFGRVTSVNMFSIHQLCMRRLFPERTLINTQIHRVFGVVGFFQNIYLQTCFSRMQKEMEMLLHSCKQTVKNHLLSLRPD